LQRIKVHFTVVVEPQEYAKYCRIVKPECILVLPHRDQGLVVTRNWIWDYAASLGTHRFWTFDDNITCFYRLNRNTKYKLGTCDFLAAIEDFADRYSNLVVCGMNYDMMTPRRNSTPALTMNTRVYSNMLILTDAKASDGKSYRNEGFFNDDTDLCLRILKNGDCVCQFNAFVIKKITTMKIAGGMTPHYQEDGRYKMAKELRDKHPDVVKISRKWGRWQHQVDYRPFKGNKLIRKAGVEIPQGVNNYGMVLRGARDQ
jgi:hypothetical protein